MHKKTINHNPISFEPLHISLILMIISYELYSTTFNHGLKFKYRNIDFSSYCVKVMLSFVDKKSASLRKIVRDDISSHQQFDTVDETFKDFKSATSAIIKSNLSLLNEVPLYKLSVEDLKEFLTREIKKDLSEDLLFEKSIEIGRYARDMFKSMDSYFRQIFSFHEELKKDLYSKMFSASKMFLNSDLPLLFMKSIGDSLLAEIDYVSIFDKEIRKERFDLIKYRNNRPKFERVCEAHNLWVKKFDQIRSKMEHEQVKLIWYIDFNNSESVDEIFEDKIIKTSLLDKLVLNELIVNLQKYSQEMEKLNMSKIEIHTFLRREVDEGARTLVRMMQILNQ